MMYSQKVKKTHIKASKILLLIVKHVSSLTLKLFTFTRTNLLLYDQRLDEQ